MFTKIVSFLHTLLVRLLVVTHFLYFPAVFYFNQIGIFHLSFISYRCCSSYLLVGFFSVIFLVDCFFLFCSAHCSDRLLFSLFTSLIIWAYIRFIFGLIYIRDIHWSRYYTCFAAPKRNVNKHTLISICMRYNQQRRQRPNIFPNTKNKNL